MLGADKRVLENPQVWLIYKVRLVVGTSLLPFQEVVLEDHDIDVMSMPFQYGVLLFGVEKPVNFVWAFF